METGQNKPSSSDVAALPAAGTPNQPREIFVLAEGYVCAANVLMANLARQMGIKANETKSVTFQREEWHRIVPVTVLQEFAISLYLKALHAMDAGATPQTDDLRELYDLLPKSTKTQLEATYEDLRKHDPEFVALEKSRPNDSFCIDAVLERSRDALAKWQRAYEIRASATGTRSDSALIGRATQKLILRREPSWDVVDGPMGHPGYLEQPKPKPEPSPSRPATLPRVGRNDRCPCASGKKYKACCGRFPITPQGIAPDSRLMPKMTTWVNTPLDPSIPPPPRWTTPATFRYPPVGRCIYCDADTYEPNTRRRLGDEHIVPEGLGGHLLLQEASCRSCEGITSGFEGTCLRKGFGPLRLFLKMPSKRPKDRPTTLPVIINATPEEDGVWADVPVEMFPVIVPLIKFHPPVVMGGPGDAVGYTVLKGHYLLPPHDLNRRLEVIRRHLNARHVQLRSDYTWCWQLLRMIGKIAHAYLVAEVGYGRFKPLLRDAILAGDHSLVTRHVGQMDDTEEKNVSGHVISREIARIGGRDHHVVRVRLFGAYGLPEYVAVAGEVL